MKLVLVLIAMLLRVANTDHHQRSNIIACNINAMECMDNNSESATCSLYDQLEGDVTVDISDKNCTNGWYNFSVSFNDTDLKYISGKLDHFNETLSNITNYLNNIWSRIEYSTKFNVTLKDLINCENPNSIFCLVLIGLGGAITVLLFIIMIMCLVIICLVAKRKRYQFSPGVTPSQRGTVENHTQQQQQRPQNQDSGAQQTNFYHVLDPQYDTIENKKGATTKAAAEAINYCEPDQPAMGKTKTPELEEGPVKAKSQSIRSKTSQEGLTEKPAGMLYDELVGPGHNTESKSTDSPVKSSKQPSMPKYSSLHLEEKLEKEEARELIPLYSVPDKSKKIDARQLDSKMKAKEIEISKSQTLTDDHSQQSEHRATTTDMRWKRQTSSPTAPELPPKPGQTNKAVEVSQQDEEAAYAEVSSRPPPSSGQWPSQSTPDGSVFTGTMVTAPSIEHLMMQSTAIADVGQGNVRRSMSLAGVCNTENENALLQQSLDTEFHHLLLYDEPLNITLISSNTAVKAPRKDRREEEDTLGYFHAS